MNSAKRGVILVSFGSVAASSKMPMEMKKKFLEAFSKFPDVTFLWKYEIDDDHIADGYKNVIIGKWFPQTDLLGNQRGKSLSIFRPPQNARLCFAWRSKQYFRGYV